MAITTEVASLDIAISANVELPNVVIYDKQGKGVLRSFGWSLSYDTGYSFRITIDGRLVFETAQIASLGALGSILNANSNVLLGLPFNSSLKIELSAVKNSSHRTVNINFPILREV